MDAGSVREARRTWDLLAPSFDATRRRPWAPVVEFLRSLPPRSRLVDAGVGNGRHALAGQAAALRTVGVDVSRALLRITHAKVGCPVVQGALERLPFLSGAFDAAIAVASVHHVRGREHRVEAWRELRRVVRPGSPAFVTVWARDQPRFAQHVPSSGDVELAWRAGSRPVSRFVHLYLGPELRAEVEEAGWTVQEQTQPALAGEAPDNHAAILRSPSGL